MLKMTALYKVLLIFAVTAMAVAYYRPVYSGCCGIKCDLDICRTTKCKVITKDECKKGVIRQGGGFCKCCQNCIKPLKLGDCCKPNPGYGIPFPVHYCDIGLTCDCKTKRCVPCGECHYPFQ